MDVEAFNAADDETAAATLRLCCVSQRWIDGMLAGRPYPSAEALSLAADTIWGALDKEDVLQAFAGHPKIGDLDSLEVEHIASRNLASSEQAGAIDADVDISERLAKGNQRYLQRFGYLFIVCASGQSAGQMCEALEARLANTPDDELPIAAEEQRKILQLRLEQLL